MTGFTVYDTGKALPQMPRVIAEAAPCQHFKWYVEIHVSFYYEGDIDLKEYPDYHYQDLDKHFWTLRSAVRYGQRRADALSWFFYEEYKRKPDRTPSFFANIRDLTLILDEY